MSLTWCGEAIANAVGTAGGARYDLRSSANPSHASGSATAQRTATGRNAAPPNLA